ncbi:hypothetical protein ABW19_dt0206303 [Dactylella cylindrospora]|nr:hypothetical protein ABW19_dt0206303 [Dactylella cylindrospora]
MPNPQIHAVIVNGGDPDDINLANTFLSTTKLLFSHKIIPTVFSTYDSDTHIRLMCEAEFQNFNPFEHCNFEPFTEMLPTSTPSVKHTAKEAKNILEILRPFYANVHRADLKLELRKWMLETAQRLQFGDKILVIICAQGIHSSGCMLQGRALTSQEVWEYMETLPVKCTAVVVNVAPGSDERMRRAVVFDTMDGIWDSMDGEVDIEVGAVDDWGDFGQMRFGGKGVYLVAKIEVMKTRKKGWGKYEVRHVKDTIDDMAVGDIDVLGGQKPLKLAPWAYTTAEWEIVESVVESIGKVVDQELCSRIGRVRTVMNRISNSTLWVKDPGPLDLPLQYLQIKMGKLHQHPGTIGLLGMMKRVVDQFTFCRRVSSLYLFQRRIEETLRFIERTDLRVEAFLQDCYKSGMFHTLNTEDWPIDQGVLQRLTDHLAVISPAFESIIVPPDNCVAIEYFERAHEIVRLAEFHSQRYSWFQVEIWIEHLNTNL